MSWRITSSAIAPASDAAGVDRGLGKPFGRSARLFKQTEVEADRLSVWLLAGAGYDPAAAGRFWTAFGQRKGRPLFQAGTHPGWRDRVASLEAEAAADRCGARIGPAAASATDRRAAALGIAAVASYL